MGLSENSDDHIRKRHQELCSNLNMDSATTSQAWDSYESIKQHYTLEGDPLHWLACAIYVACRKSTAPTVGQTGSIVKGNCVSLTRLLRLCNFSLTQFFAKSKKWADMANMPQDFRKRIDRLERNFAVCCVIFKRYHVIFNEIFQTPIDDQPKQHRSRKQRNLPCTPSRVFEFCWTLFVCIKGEYVSCSDDLVTSFHLLLACCDMAFNNALFSDRRDLLNPKFSGLPENFSSSDYVKPTTSSCIIDILCQKFEGYVVDAKWVKEYSWKVAVKKLFDKEVLQGDTSTLTGLFEATNFDNNMRAVNKVYEEHVLNVGEFDEKIFIDGDLTNTIGSPKNTPTTDEKINRNINNQFDDQIQQQLVIQTPLTGRKYHRSRDMQRPAPLSTATQSVIRLQTLLNGRTNEASGELKEIFMSCARDPAESIKNRLRELGDKFITAYVQNSDQNGVMDLAKNRLSLSETLYYKLLENIVQDEKVRNPNLDITYLLEQDIFHRCMFACSIEIVIYSYNSQRKFPWILQALDLKGYYFYRVIELIVRTKDQLSRDVVKHLNSIEEQILESIAWDSDSPLWECLFEDKVPSCEDTAIPGQLSDGSNNPSIKKIQNSTPNVQQSPVTTASERFQSPISSSVVKKKLFVDPQSSKVKPGQSLLQNSSKTVAIVIVDDKGNKKLIPLSEFGGEAPNQNQNQKPVDVKQEPKEQPITPQTPLRPKRNGSLALFFRKFYNLAGVRMEELCNQLQVDNIELKRKIFTCFEHCIIELTPLMKDRHLDQILMCAVYVVCKATTNEKSFTEIMRCYRLQPQAHSHVYRSVLIYKLAEGEAPPADISASPPSSTRRTPGELAGTSTTHGREYRGDLIKFYNTIFMLKVMNFALQFAGAQQRELHLSPLPVTKMNPSSPKRRVTDNVYVRPYEQTESPNLGKQYMYFFSRSPSKDLQNINRVINSTRGCKRLLTGEVDDEDVTPIKVNRKLQGLIEERLVQTKD